MWASADRLRPLTTLIIIRGFSFVVKPLSGPFFAPMIGIRAVSLAF
jgi:hypothetical protein